MGRRGVYCSDHLARMPSSRLPQKVFFSWFAKKRPFCGPRKRWKDAISKDLRQVKIAPDTWFDLASNRTEWHSMCRSALCPEAAEPQLTKSCDLCGREFRSIAGFKRHKCSAEQLKPLHEQHGAVQCSHCERWFASHGGLSACSLLHRCIRKLSANTTSRDRANSSSTDQPPLLLLSLQYLQPMFQVSTRVLPAQLFSI